MAWSSDSCFQNNNSSDQYSNGVPNVRFMPRAFCKPSSRSSAEPFPNHPRSSHLNRPSYSATNHQARNFSSGFRGRGRGQGRLFGRTGFTNESRRSVEGVSYGVADKFSEVKLSEVSGNHANSGAINFGAYEDVEVVVTGSNIPSKVNSFSDLDLGEPLDNNINLCNYVKPTPIQRHALPIAVAGRDLMACAQTGSGKTAAFCFPIISGILKTGVLTTRGGAVAYPSALILCPTRELACQINDEAKKFAFQSGLKIGVAYGGAPIWEQFRNLKRGVDILVATPGRLSDMFDRGGVSLKNIRYLALDEADRMLDMGFEPQIRKIVMQMDMPVAGSRQTMLFSATFPSEIQRLASDFLSDYIFLTVGRVGSSTELISQRVEDVSEIDKRSRLYDILKSYKSIGNTTDKVLTLVFVETKKGADALEWWLSDKGLPAIAIHGDKLQMERERALRSFKTGVTPILVATDVASRGLDIPHVSHVVNFDLPKDIDSYVHRIGRTGRAGRSGTATAFFSEKDLPLAKALVELMLEASQEVPVWLSEYAEMSLSSGSSRPRGGGGSKFGGRDFRCVKQSHFGNVCDNFGNGDPSVDPKTHEVRNTELGYSTSGLPKPNYSDSIVPTGWMTDDDILNS